MKDPPPPPSRIDFPFCTYSLCVPINFGNYIIIIIFIAPSSAKFCNKHSTWLRLILFCYNNNIGRLWDVVHWPIVGITLLSDNAQVTDQQHGIVYNHFDDCTCMETHSKWVISQGISKSHMQPTQQNSTVGTQGIKAGYVCSVVVSERLS